MKNIILLVVCLIPVFAQGQQIKEQVSDGKVILTSEYIQENKTASELYKNFRIYLSDNYHGNGVAPWDRSVVNKYYQTKKSGTIYSDTKSPQNNIEVDYDLEVDFSDNLIIYKASAITYSCSEKDIKDLSIEDLRNNKPQLAKVELDRYKIETTKYFQGYFSKTNQYIIGVSGGKRKILPELKMDSEVAISEASSNIQGTKQANRSQENKINTSPAVNQSPMFPGGQQALDRYLADNLKYSDKTKLNAISGKVVVSFVIEMDGSITAIKIIRGLCAECDEEIIRVLKAAPKWKPAIYEGRIARVSRYLTVPFNM